MTLISGPDERDHRLGTLGAPLVIVEYGDFECPYTAASIDAVAGVREEYGDRLLYVYRSFPLYDIHPHALRAAEAGEAAAAQGTFWPMFELLFERRRLDDRSLLRYAEELGLDAERFAGELANGAHLERLEVLLASGKQSGVLGTPTFFINGEYHHHKSGLWSWSDCGKPLEWRVIEVASD